MKRITRNHPALKRKHQAWRSRVTAAAFFATLTAAAASGQSLELFDANTAGTTYAVAVAPLSTTGQFVTALANSNFDLEVIAWQNNTSTRSISRLGEYTAGLLGGSITGGQYLSVTGISNNRFVTALMNSSGYLELIVFAVNANGSITRLGSATGSLPIYALALTTLDAQRVVTVTTDTARATVTTWIVDASGAITAQAVPWIIETPGYSVAVAAMSTAQIVVAQSNGPNADTGAVNPLTLTSFSVDSSGALLEQSADYTGQNGNANFYALGVAALGGGNLAVDCLDDTAFPIVSLWNISASGRITELAFGQNAQNFADTLAIANMGGMAFTIDNSGQQNNLYAITLWGGTQGAVYQVAASSTQPGCGSFCGDGNVAAASLEGEIVTATAGGSNGLNVAVWLYLP